jgi:hypothetical protein
LPGWSVVLSEVAASTLLLTVIQLSLLLISYLAFLGNSSMHPALEGRTLILAAAFLFLPAVNLLGMLIQNGVALLYPGWVRLGSGRAGGVEALGQNFLMMVAFIALLATVLALPVAIGGGAYLLLRPTMNGWAVVPSSVLALLVMTYEAALLVGWLGRVFERTDPASAGIVT